MAHRGGALKRLVAAVLSFALFSSVIHVAPAVAAPITPAPVRRELTDKRTAFSRTWDNRDGTYTYESYFEPIHYKDPSTGLFEGIDSTLEETVTPSGKGFKNRRNAFTVFLPETVSKQPVWIGDELGSVRLTPKGRLVETPVHQAYEETSVPTPMVGNSRRYERAFGAADIVYDSVPQGLKETIVLRSYTGKNAFSFDLDCPGYTPSLDSSGSIAFTSTSTGEVRFRMIPPYMEDSSATDTQDAAYSDAVRFELKAVGIGWRLDIVADTGWLSDPARVYPVKIDPTTYWVGTFQDEYMYDAYVSDAYPSTNYGYLTQARVGRHNAIGTGTTRTYLKPSMVGLPTDISVLYARLEAYCYDRAATSGTSRVNCASASGSWTEGGLTWNNQPSANEITYDDVAENEWGAWNVTSIVQNFVLGLTPNDGFRLYSSSESADLTLCHFYTFESTGASPRLTVDFTSEPTVEVLSPSVQMPVGDNATAAIHARLRYGDAMGKKLNKVQAQVASSIVAPTIVKDVTVETSAPVVEIPAPSGGWTQEHYWVRARVWGAGDEGLEAYSAPSDWTEWQPFDRASLGSSNDGQGLLPWRATEPIGAGLSVDLANGQLIGLRSDVSFQALGGALTYGATYCSTRTADVGLGKGWAMASPSLTYAPQKAPNPGFEQTPFVGDGNDPPGWFINSPAQTSWAYLNRTQGGRYSLKLWNNGTTYGNVWVATGSGAAQAFPVSPGERITASVWVQTESFNPDTTQAEHGALMKFHFFDGKSVEMNHATYSKVSEGFCAPSTTSWKQITLEATVPEGVYGVQLNLELRNAKGIIRFDDVEFCDKTIEFTDGDGTSRTIEPAEDGTYKRDPLEPGVAFSRVNVALGADVTAVGGTIDSESVDGIINDCVGLGNYDGVLENSSGTNHLTYDLKHAQVLSEADLYLWDGGLEISEATQPNYTYRIETSVDGETFTQVVPTDSTTQPYTGSGWMKHAFTPVRARYVRVVALNNTYDTGFRLCEIELPQLRLGDAVVCFDDSGRLQAIGDLSGNPVTYAYDASGRLTSVRDASVTTATKGVDLVWSGTELARVDCKGVSSSGEASTETGIVKMQTVGDEYRLLRTLDGTDVPVATYTYNGDGRISGVKDATGIGYTIGYSPAGQVTTVTASGAPTETVTTFSYGTGYVDIASSAGGLAAPVRRVSYDAALGSQVTSVRIDDPTSAEDPTTTFAYDEYGMLWKATDPLGRVTRTERDANGLAIVTARQSASGALLEQTKAYYESGHLVESLDQKENVSKVSYDDAWRVLSAQQVVTDVAGEGESADMRTYDEWGNLATQAVPGATTYNLLRNGTFEIDPLVAGNGWDGAKGEGQRWDTAVQEYLGGHSLQLGSDMGASYLTSDEIPVLHDKTYALSAWMQNWGQVIVAQYDDDHQFVSTYVVLQSASLTGELRRVSANYRVPDGVAYVRVRPYTESKDGFSVDNLRFELANTASGDSFTENESMEQVVSGLPRAWHRRSTVYTAAVHEATTSEKVAGATSAHIGHTTSSALGYFTSDVLPVHAGEKYTVSASLKTKASVGGAKAIVRYSDSSGTLLTSLDVTITAGLIKGTEDWCRYIRQVTVPAGAAKMQINFYHEIGGGDAYMDAVVITPSSGITQTGYDATTHAYPVVATSATGVVANTSYDARGRATETSVTPPGGTKTSLTKRSYDELDRMKTVETAPGSGLGITASFSYDAAGRLISLTGPRSTTTTIAYDAAGRVTGVASPTGIRSKTVYDNLGRLLNTFAPAQGEEPTRAVSLTQYDSLSRPKTTTTFAEDGTTFAVRTLTYDIASRVTAETLTGATAASASTDYDDLDRVTLRSESGPAGDTSFAYTYDAASLPLTQQITAFGETTTTALTYAKTNELAKINSAGRTWYVAYAGSGGLSSIWSNLSIHTRSFDIYGRLEAVRTGFKYPDQTYQSDLAESVLSYDTRGRISAQQILSSYQDSSESFSYDAADRLSAWTRTGLGAGSATYGYDPSGNLTTATVSGATTTLSYDLENRLTRSATGSSVTTFTNDLYGRRTGKITGSASTAYMWNPAGRLTEVASADATATYAYGISGMRELKTVTTPSGTTTTKSVWSGGQLAVELDSDGTRYTYLWGPNRIPLSVTARTVAGVSTTYAYHTDALGSVLAMTDAAGGVVARYTYDPWGRVTSATNSEIAARNPLRYRAYYLDAETGLYYMPARYYDPATARFLSVDPAAPSAGDPSSLNAFAYCLDDPVNAIDPSGATVDIDGNGRIDAEDSITEQYIQTPEGPRKRARWWGMWAATRVARDPTADAISIAMAARHNRDAAMASAAGGSSGAQIASINWSLLPTKPTSVDWALMGFGAAYDWFGLCLFEMAGGISGLAAGSPGGPAGAGAGGIAGLGVGGAAYIVGSRMLDIGVLLYTLNGFLDGQRSKSLGDVVVAAVPLAIPAAGLNPGYSTGVFAVNVMLAGADKLGGNVYSH